MRAKLLHQYILGSCYMGLHRVYKQRTSCISDTTTYTVLCIMHMIPFVPCVSVTSPYIDNWIYFVLEHQQPLYAAIRLQTSRLVHADVNTTKYQTWHTNHWTQTLLVQSSNTEYRLVAQMPRPHAIPTELCPAHWAMQSQWWHFEDCFH